MTHATRKGMTLFAALLLTASCLVFTAPGVQSESVEAAALIVEGYTEVTFEEVVEPEISEEDLFVEPPVPSSVEENPSLVKETVEEEPEDMPVLDIPQVIPSTAVHSGPGMSMAVPVFVVIDEIEEYEDVPSEVTALGSSAPSFKMPPIEESYEEAPVDVHVVVRIVVHDAVYDEEYLRLTGFSMIIDVALAVDDVALPEKDEVEDTVEPVFGFSVELSETDFEDVGTPIASVVDVIEYDSVIGGGDYGIAVSAVSAVLARLA